MSDFSRFSGCCDWGVDFIQAIEVDFDTPWSGGQSDKLYLQSGQFSSTLKTSQDVSGYGYDPVGISWDGTNTPWAALELGFTPKTRKLMLQSGQFSSTLKTSEDVSTVISNINPSFSQGDLRSISSDGNTPWCANRADVVTSTAKLFLNSGQFTSTIKSSLMVDATNGSKRPSGITTDGTDTIWADQGVTQFVLQSGQFTSTIKSSQSISGAINDCEWDGTNMLTIVSTGKLLLYSGKFSTTIKTSQAISTIDSTEYGISSNSIGGRS